VCGPTSAGTSLQPNEGPSETRCPRRRGRRQSVLQPNEGPSETHAVQSGHPARQRFNPTRVLLKHGRGGRPRRHRRFNPTRVLLKPVCRMGSAPLFMRLQPNEGPSETQQDTPSGRGRSGFNPTRVLLKRVHCVDGDDRHRFNPTRVLLKPPTRDVRGAWSR